MKKMKAIKIGLATYYSPLGELHITTDEIGVRRIDFTQQDWIYSQQELGTISFKTELCEKAIYQLDEYFTNKRTKFDLPLSIYGTDFQKKVWKALLEIPYGEVRSYKDIAVAIGTPTGCRAVGQANRANPLPILIPCHRVIGQSGKMVGYAGKQTDLKEKLLMLEGYLKRKE